MNETIQQIADQYAGESCLLNDQPAMIAGRLHDFAHVVDIESGASYEWAWPTVKRIMERDKKFRVG
jgi:hypothetical protein